MNDARHAAKTTISLSLVLTATQALASSGVEIKINDTEALSDEGLIADSMLSSIDGWRCLAENHFAITNTISKDGKTLFDIYIEEGVSFGADAGTFGEQDFTNQHSASSLGNCYGNCYANCHQNCYGDCHGDDS